MKAKDPKLKPMVLKQKAFSQTNSIAFLSGVLLTVLFLPISSIADESDYKVDTKNAFVVQEKKAQFSDYKGNLLQKKPGMRDMSEQIFKGQKLFIERTGEMGGRLLYNGKPLKLKDGIQFTHLLFSPDYQTVMAYGFARWSEKQKQFCFINSQGEIISSGELRVDTAKICEKGFVAVCYKSDPYKLTPTNEPPKFYLCKWDFNGDEIWKKELLNGLIAEHFPQRLSVSPNGRFVIVGLDGVRGSPKSTRIFDENGNEIERLNDAYFSYIADDNETAIFVSHKRVMVLDLIKKSMLFKQDEPENSKGLLWIAKDDPRPSFGSNDNEQSDKVVVTGSNKIIVLDPKSKQVTRWDPGPTDRENFEVLYSVPEKKLFLNT